MLANSPVVVDALVESLRHDPFYVAITEGHGADETRRSEALSRYFDYLMSEGARVGRCIQSIGDAPAAAVWLLPLSPEQAAAEASAKAVFLESALESKGAQNYHRIVEFMASRSRSIVSSAAWYLSIVGVASNAQGRGAGGRLIRTTLAEADQVGAPSFLETFAHRNDTRPPNRSRSRCSSNGTLQISAAKARRIVRKWFPARRQLSISRTAPAPRWMETTMEFPASRSTVGIRFHEPAQENL